jgi:16S rRNA (adenine1518-N6/adenine1519-N6)-dimethyltransferase
MLDPTARQLLVSELDIAPGETVWEVGPGLGAETGALLAAGARVTVFEIDAGFCSVLTALFGANERFTLSTGDVLKTWRQVPTSKPVKVLGNLPYNIAGRLLGDFFEDGLEFRKMLVTVQKETAERLVARPGSREYSSLSVLAAARSWARVLKVLSGAAFYPAPNVDSAIVSLEAVEGPTLPAVFAPMVRSLFASRRKTVRNNLARFLAGRGDSRDARALLREAGISENARAETLAVADFHRLACVV